jgi:hypothetical protein
MHFVNAGAALVAGACVLACLQARSQARSQARARRLEAAVASVGADGTLEDLTPVLRTMIGTIMKPISQEPQYKRSSMKGHQMQLWKKMKKGKQELSDFSGGAESERQLWAYVKTIFAKRAFNVSFSLCAVVRKDERFARALLRRQASRAAEASAAGAGSGRGQLRVASLGGGPGNCLVGFVVFERLLLLRADRDAAARRNQQQAGTATAPLAARGSGSVGPAHGVTGDATADATADAAGVARLSVLDYAKEWGPIVTSHTAAALAEPVSFGLCDLAQPLEAPANAAVRALLSGDRDVTPPVTPPVTSSVTSLVTSSSSSSSPDVVLFAFTLHEADHDKNRFAAREPKWAPLFLAVWDALRPGAVVLVKDQDWLEDKVVALLEGCRPAGSFLCCRESDGLFLLKPSVGCPLG